jgi:hypothetical protein
VSGHVILNSDWEYRRDIGACSFDPVVIGLIHIVDAQMLLKQDTAWLKPLIFLNPSVGVEIIWTFLVTALSDGLGLYCYRIILTNSKRTSVL